ncbi:MAG: TIGR01841 family phasin [Gammaproteobacteria bacterium]|nr:TIGR01841 family phasin [Gammaproteobacteria bacterium]MDH4252965.1 TIGR01841 family phasin [Gammaproteobacteria bacterium]MDH5308349.1 TIGR01841 family phasin [Gammaproteobacteria bacterium]
MNARVETPISRIATEARGRYDAIVATARSRTEKAAGRVVEGKKPVQTLSKLGLKLSAVSHRTADRVMKQQAKMLEHQIDAVAQRLNAAAAAKNLRELIRTQARLIPANASRFAEDTRETLAIVAGAGGEVRDLLAETVGEIRGRKRAARKPATTRKATAKKATAKKPAAKQKAAGKPAARKPAPRRTAPAKPVAAATATQAQAPAQTA